MVTDPIADFLIRIQNASKVRRDTVSVPYSAMKLELAKLLAREGYVGEVEKKTSSNAITIALKYGLNGRPIISGARRISKPSRRLYAGVRDIRPVKSGHGLLVLSTPAGVMTGKEAKTKRLGGETLFEIW